MNSRYPDRLYKVLTENMSEETTVTKLIQVLRETKLKDSYSGPLNTFRLCYGNDFNSQEDTDCDEVYPNIFIGDGTTAKNKPYLRRIGITHVLNTAEGKTCTQVDTNEYFYRDTPFKYLGFRLVDLPGENISNYFNEAANFIDDAIQSHGKVYVHCLMGMSRSSTCVIAYLMLKKGYTAAEAIRIVKERRSIHPNEGFLRQLADLDNRLRRERDPLSFHLR